MTSVRSNDYWRLTHEARYAQRLCERTARLYRRAQTVGVFLSVLGGSAAISASANWWPAWVPAAGAVALALVGGAMLAVRPGEKAAQNEGDVRKYAELLRQAPGLDDVALTEALAKARLTDVPELETLRQVAYNDLVVEVGTPELAAPLTVSQRLLSAVA